MKVTRKIQRHVEAKIKHAIATGPLPYIARGSITENHHRQADKAEENDAKNSK